MKKIIKVLFIVVVLFTSSTVFAADINLTVRDGGDVFVGTVSLPTSITSLNDRDGVPHAIDANSVLSALVSAGQTSGSFSIADADLQFFPPFDPDSDPVGSFLVNCITITSTAARDCDNWQYAVGSSSPQTGMDKPPYLSGGENVYVYFGPQNKVVLGSDNINTEDTLTVTAQNYDYVNNVWTTRTGVTVGLTQPDPDHPFSPIEIKTEAVDENGQATFSSIPVGSYNVGIQNDFYFPTENLTVTTPPPPSHHSSGGGSIITKPDTAVPPPTKSNFNLNKSFAFLISQQKENGSFGSDLYTDWATLALASGNNQTSVLKLIRYFGGSKMESPGLTDYERRSMALMTLGLNPYNTNGENYIQKITAAYDGKQFGDVNEDNDDIFALIVLQNAGYTESEKMISDDIAFILSKQKTDGSWDESVDMTGAAIEALSVFSPSTTPGVAESLTKAKNFLKQTQKDNGGWNDSPSSTAWALEGILALAEKPENWTKNEKTPFDYLAIIQDTDGGVKNENIQNKIWQTAYVTSSLSGKTWNQTMQKFEKPLITIEAVKKPVSKKALAKPVAKTIATPPATINAVLNENGINETTPPKRGWFAKLLQNIFGF